MSLPKRLYQSFVSLRDCALASRNRILDDDTMSEFQNLLNDALPQNDAEKEWCHMVKCIYYSNPDESYRFFTNKKNKLRALVLWTDAKRITTMFNLRNVVHLRWDKE